jgi:hypothetical protein
VPRQLSPELAYPFARVQVRMAALMVRPAEQAVGSPSDGNLPQREEIILAFDLGKLGVKSWIEPEAGQRLQITCEG